MTWPDYPTCCFVFEEFIALCQKFLLITRKASIKSRIKIFQDPLTGETAGSACQIINLITQKNA